MVADGAGAVRNATRSTTLSYGQVRLGRAEVAIGFESLPDVSAAQRGLYEQAVAATGVDPETVLVVRVGEAGIEVDAVDFDDARWPVRTLGVGATHLHERAG